MPISVPELHTWLVRLTYPATREQLLDQLRLADAPEAALVRVRTLPEHRYGSVDAVIDALRMEE